MKTIYECSLCGKQSQNLEEIDLCEKAHQTAAGAMVIQTTSYIPGSPFPDKVVLDFANGSRAQYQFVTYIPEGGTE